METVKAKILKLIDGASLQQLRKIEALTEKVLQEPVAVAPPVAIAEFDDALFVLTAEEESALKEIFKKTTKGGRKRLFDLDVFAVKEKVPLGPVLPGHRLRNVPEDTLAHKCPFCKNSFEENNLSFQKHVGAHVVCFQCPDPDCWSKDLKGFNTIFARQDTYKRHLKPKTAAEFPKNFEITFDEWDKKSSLCKGTNKNAKALRLPIRLVPTMEQENNSEDESNTE